jgi:Helix-hairpin-helix motif
MAWSAPPPPPRPPVGPAGPLVPLPPEPPGGRGWAAVPVLTGGIGAPVSFGYAALRRRSSSLGGAAVGYGVAVLGGLAGILDAGDGLAAIGVLLLLVTWIVSSVHALVVRPRVYPPASPRALLNRHVVAVARHRRALRHEARQVVADDPVLARELRIGRPDLLPRAFDDGGLIDVNHVPPEVLSRLPGLTYAMVDRIMRVRTHSGGFVSAEELAVQCDLPPSVVPEIAEYALFVR